MNGFLVKLITELELLVDEIASYWMGKESEEVATTVVGYIAKK